MSLLRWRDLSAAKPEVCAALFFGSWSPNLAQHKKPRRKKTNVLPQLQAGRNIHEMVGVPTEMSEAQVGSGEEKYH